jgi:hypothetical protein
MFNCAVHVLGPNYNRLVMLLDSSAFRDVFSSRPFNRAVFEPSKLLPAKIIKYAATK